ncbi:MAG: GNAT family N-acetyltransferase [Agathobacter sp.]|nr:GNAT family N-acetyltransferase [Agathobacter sp.]
MLIRKMKQNDAAEVYEMMRVFYDSPAVFHTSSDTVLKKDIEDCIGDTPFVEGFVFEEDGILLGYAMTAPSYTTEYGGPCIWLEDLYIKPEYRHMGLGTKLFAYLEQQYPDAVRFKLEVEQENEHAIAVYKKNGYGISPYFEMTREMTEG